MKKRDLVILFVAFLIFFDVFVWGEIVFGDLSKNPEIYFLDVGQGDSQLIILPGNVKILIDGGPNNRVLEELSLFLRPTDRYIDLVILSHPQLDHFGGLIDVLKRYQIGAFIFSDQQGGAQAFQDLQKLIKKNKVATISLVEGDKIKHANNSFDVLSPSNSFLNSDNINEASMVIRFKGGGGSVLFTGDIGEKTEDYLTREHNLNTDVLKVSHHGSKFSTSDNFLKEVAPKISVIGVGKNNYGHPTVEALNRLFSVGSRVFRTDKDGTIKIIFNNKRIDILKNKRQ